MPETEIRFTLPTSQEEVYNLISDLPAIGRCLAGVKAVRVLTDEESEWKVEVRAGVVAQTVTLRARITERKPPQALAFAATGMNIELSGRAELTPEGPGQTEVHVRARIEPRGPLAPLIELIMRRTQERLIAESVENLQQDLERRAAERSGPATAEAGPPADPLAGLAGVWSRITGLVAERGQGVRLYDTTGRGYLDFTSGIGVTNTGHCHPRVVAAVREQAGRLLHSQANIAFSPPHLELVRRLREVVPPGIDAFFFANSGAEAVEAALKLARQATGRPNVIVFQGGFHGRTIAAMSLTTAKRIYRQGYQPLMAGVAVAPFPYAYRYGWDPGATRRFCIEELRHLLATQTGPEETAGVLIEPVLGEGGYVVPPPGFLREVEALCREHGLVLILDEIQTGFGRTGRFFAAEHEGLRPDILIMAKGLASGLPLSAIGAGQELMARWPAGSHGGTYGGNVVACAAANATIDVIREEGLVENAARLSPVLLERLRAVQRDHPVIGDVRGLGLMVATEFARDGRPDPATAKAVQRRCLEGGLLLLTCGPYDNTIRWIPPLIVTEAELDEAVAIFGQTLAGAGG